MISSMPRSRLSFSLTRKSPVFASVTAASPSCRPVRREVLVAGKFLSGLTAAIVIFGGSALLQFPAMFWHHGRELMDAYMFAGPGLSHLVSYFVAAVLACIGYGSLFLAAGVLFRNPLIPAALLLVWEGINGFLPALPAIALPTIRTPALPNPRPPSPATAPWPTRSGSTTCSWASPPWPRWES